MASREKLKDYVKASEVEQYVFCPFSLICQLRKIPLSLEGEKEVEEGKHIHGEKEKEALSQLQKKKIRKALRLVLAIIFLILLLSLLLWEP